MLRSGKYALHKFPVSGEVCAFSLLKPRPEDERLFREVAQTAQRHPGKEMGVASNKGFRGRYSAICRSCGEEHRLTAEGLMSIHHDRLGQRCKGSSSAEDIKESKRQRLSGSFPRQVSDERSNRSTRERAGASRTKLSKEDRKLKSQIRKAVSEAIGNKKRKGKSGRRAVGVDKTIYVVNGVRTVSGGSPSLGKRR